MYFLNSSKEITGIISSKLGGNQKALSLNKNTISILQSALRQFHKTFQSRSPQGAI